VSEELDRRLDGAENTIHKIIDKAEGIYRDRFEREYTSHRDLVGGEDKSRDMVVMQIATMLQANLYGESNLEWIPVARQGGH